MINDKNKNELLTTYDIENEYQQKIAPFEKKITRLKKSYETKSLRLHKGFLTKEKKAQSKLSSIDNDANKAKSKIETATASKLNQLKKVDQSIKKSIKLKSDELKLSADEEIKVYQDEIDSIRDDLHEELESLHKEYLKNVHVYQEKFDSYESLSNEKHSIYDQTYKKHIVSLDKQFHSVKEFTTQLQAELMKAKKSFIKEIQQYQNTTRKHQKIAIGDASKTNETVTKKTVGYTKQIEAFIDKLKSSYVDHYKPMLKAVKDQEILLKADFTNTIDQLKDDFAFRTDEDNSSIEQGSKTREKNQKRRLALFEERFELYKLTEEVLKDRKLALLSFEQSELRQNLDKEMTNLDKLETFLKRDFEEINDHSSKIYNLENTLFSKMDDIHTKLHHHLELSTSHMIDFVDQFNQKMLTFEQNLISIIKTHLEQLHTKNLEIDRLDRELDLSEPQKEIALNDFEEDLALQEIKNRYQIKILNKEHEIHLIKQKLAYDIQLIEIEHDQKRLDNDFEITSTKVKSDVRLHVENAKRKYLKAKEIYHLRLNSLKHDEKQALLSIETRAKTIESEIEKAPYDVEKSQLLLRKEILQSIDQLSRKKELEIHMIEQKFSDKSKSLDTEINQIEQEKQNISKVFNAKRSVLKESFDKELTELKVQHEKQLANLQEAFERECKTPESNIQKWQEFQNKKIHKFDLNIDYFSDEYQEEMSKINTIEDLDVLVDEFNPDDIITNTTNMIFGFYDIYLDTVDTLFTITKESLEDQASLSIETTTQKKLARDLEKKVKDFAKQITNIKRARDQQVKSYVFSLNNSFKRIQKEKFQSPSGFLDAINEVHEDTKDALQGLKKELTKEINELFQPITEHDMSIIESAKASQSHAKSKLEEEYLDKKRPIEIKHKRDLKDLDQEEVNQTHTFDDRIQELNDKKKYLDTKMSEEIASLEKDYDSQMEPFNEHIASLDASRDKGETEVVEKLNTSLKELQQQEKTTLNTFETKIEEAKRILDYEEKIEQTTLESLKAKEDDELQRKQAIIDSEKEALDQQITLAKKTMDNTIDELKDKLYKKTSSLDHENYLANPEIQKEMQKLRNSYEQKETNYREELLENKKLVRHIIDSFEQQVRGEYNQFYDQLNQHIERMKKSYSKNIYKEIDIFHTLHQELFEVLQQSYEDTLKSMKSHTLELTQQLHRLNKNLS